MIIADASLWIEFLKKAENIFPAFRRLLEYGRIIGLECIFGELLQGAKNNRERNMISGYWQSIPKIDEKNLWIEAGLHSGKKQLLSKGVGLIDAFLIVAANRTKSKIWTLDKKLLAVLNESEVYVPEYGINGA